MTHRLGSLPSSGAVVCVLVCAIVTAVTSCAYASTVNIDFGPSASVYSGQGALSAPGDVWNAYAGGIPANPLNDLLDSTGSVTSVGIAFVPGLSAPGQIWPPYLNPTAISGGLDAPHPLFANSVRNGGADPSTIGKRAFGITLSGLKPLRQYGLAFYAAFTHSTQGLHLAQVEINDAASFPAPLDSTMPAGTKGTTGMGTTGFEENVNYVLFSNVLSDSDGKIFANVWNGPDNARYALNALQIQLVPEPASTALLGIGGLLLMSCRRRA